jgi:glycosyltransferase involved in cell wall biosynthesis
MPNAVLGLLYKLLWQAQVVMDIDDDEMAFFPNYQGGEYADGSSLPEELPVSHNLVGPEWTSLAVGCSTIFDAVTVSNPVLRDRFGGDIIRHARAEAEFDPACYPQAAVRQRYNVGETERVVLFLGTPRAHKGLLEAAAALDALDRSDVTFLVVGSFPRGQEGLRDQLEAFPRLRCRFLPDQPFTRVPELVALSDICLALQDPNSPVTVSQVPAKLSDALAMGRLAVVNDNPALRDLPLTDHVVIASWDDLREVLARALAGLPESEEKRQARRTLFLQEFSVVANRRRLQAVLAGLPREPKPALFEFMERVLKRMPGFPPELLRLTENWK